MPKCKYCQKTIGYVQVQEVDRERTLPVEIGISEFITKGALMEGQQVHSCPEYQKRHKRRQTIGKYSKGENPSVA